MVPVAPTTATRTQRTSRATCARNRLPTRSWNDDSSRHSGPPRSGAKPSTATEVYSPSVHTFVPPGQRPNSSPRMARRPSARGSKSRLGDQIDADSRIGSVPHSEMLLDLAALLILARGATQVDLNHAAARALDREARSGEMRTEIVDEGSVVDSNQHGPQSFASLPHTPFSLEPSPRAP